MPTKNQPSRIARSLSATFDIQYELVADVNFQRLEDRELDENEWNSWITSNPLSENRSSVWSVQTSDYTKHHLLTYFDHLLAIET